MRHRVEENRLSRPHDQNRALLRALATELLRHDEIVTTLAKAKALRSEADRLITLAKKGRLSDPKMYEKLESTDQDEVNNAGKAIAKHVHYRRQMLKFIYDKAVVNRAFTELAPRYEKRQGGYTRVIKTHHRRGDAAPMALIQLV